MWPLGDEPPWPMISSTRARTTSRDTPSRSKAFRCDPLALVDEPEEQVLGAYVVVVEKARLLLGEHDHGS